MLGHSRESAAGHPRLIVHLSPVFSLNIWEPVTKLLQTQHLVIRPSAVMWTTASSTAERRGAKVMSAWVLLDPHVEGQAPRPVGEDEPAFEPWLITNYLCDQRHNA